MQIVSTAMVPTSSGARYVQQLVKHWSHKFQTSYADGHGEVPFNPETLAAFDVSEEGIDVRLTTPDAESDEKMRSVIERHLDRFAFREAPLTFLWAREQ